MYRIITLLLILITSVGCKKDHHSKIEVYLLKDTIESYEGISFKDAERFMSKDVSYEKILKEYDKLGMRYDTVTGAIIYSGDFIAGENDLEDVPFIKDNEILSFNTDYHYFAFDTIVCKRISDLKIGMFKGVQFVVAVDREPVLRGYFRNVLSSYVVYSYQINNRPGYFGMDRKRDFNLGSNEALYYFGYADFVKSYQKNFIEELGENIVGDYEKKRPLYNPKLIEALRVSGRLIE